MPTVPIAVADIGTHTKVNNDVSRADNQPYVEAPEEAGTIYYGHTVPALKTKATAVAPAEATSSSLPSPKEHLESMLAPEHSLPNTLARSGSSVPSERSEFKEGSIDSTRNVVPPASPSLENLHFEPKALFSQVRVPLRDFEKLNEQRLDLVTTHVRAREFRKILRDQRATVSERQSKLLQDLRVLILKGGQRDLDHLLLELNETEKLNDNLKSAEESFDQLEAELIEKEWELKVAELRLYRRDTGAVPDLDNGQSWQEPDYRISHAEALSSDVTGVYARSAEHSTANLARTSEIGMLKAQIRELELEHQQLMQEEILRKDVGISLDDDSSFALRTFSVRHAELVQHLERYEARLEEKQEILSGPVLLDTSFDQFPAYQYTGDDLEVLYRQYSPNGMAESVVPWSDELTLSVQDLPLSRNQLLLPMTLLGDDEPSPAPFAAFANAEDHGRPPSLTYINDWLLYMLRSSFLEVQSLQFHLDSKTVGKDSKTVKELILSVWYNDDSYILYVESVQRAAESLDSTIFSHFEDTRPQPTLSYPNLVRWNTQITLNNQSRSMFAHRDEVKDLSSKMKGLLMSE